MIARLKGILEEKSKEQVVIDVQGVGYGLLVPDTVLQKMPDLGSEVSVYVYTHVREDQLSLFGFLSQLEKDVFLILLSANGVGPKVALSILSSLEAMQILEGVVQTNRAIFAGITGVGKKTVEKIFVEIREKAEKRLLLERGGDSGVGSKRKSSTGAAMPMATTWTHDLEQALVSLGYRDSDVKSVVREIYTRGSEIQNFDAGLKYALRVLSSGPKNLRGNA